MASRPWRGIQCFNVTNFNQFLLACDETLQTVKFSIAFAKDSQDIATDVCAICSLNILSQLNQHMYCQNKANTFLTSIKRKQNMVADV